jgi:hypothetical protein
VPSGGDCFESGVHSEGTEEVSDVVPDRFRTEAELDGDLLCRATLLEQAKNLGLPGGQARVRRGGFLVDGSVEEPEDPDNAFVVDEGYRAELECDARSVGCDQGAGRVSGGRGAEDFAREEFTRARTVLRRNDRGEVSASDIAEQLLCRRVDPPNDSGGVEDVARHADAAESSLDIATHR